MRVRVHYPHHFPPSNMLTSGGLDHSSSVGQRWNVQNSGILKLPYRPGIYKHLMKMPKRLTLFQWHSCLCKINLQIRESLTSQCKLSLAVLILLCTFWKPVTSNGKCLYVCQRFIIFVKIVFCMLICSVTYVIVLEMLFLDGFLRLYYTFLSNFSFLCLSSYLVTSY